MTPTELEAKILDLEKTLEAAQKRFSMRDTIALIQVVGVTGVVFYLMYQHPESQAAQIALGAYLTVGFASVVSFYFGSSVGSDKKDDTQAKMAVRLAEKVTTTQLSNGVPYMEDVDSAIPWWSLFTDNEKVRITGAASMNKEVADFMAKAVAGTAKPEELDKLVTYDVLTPERVVTLKEVAKQQRV
jgi:hypothetical protein